MNETKVLRVTKDPVGWTVTGDRHPRSYVDRAHAIERARVVASTQLPCRIQVFSEAGDVEEEIALV